VRREDWGFDALLGPALPEEANPMVLTPEFYNRVVDRLSALYDYVIIDGVADPWHPLLRAFALPRCDYLLVPVTPSEVALTDTHAWLVDIVTTASVQAEKIGLVVNRMRGTVGLSEAQLRQETKPWSIRAIIPERPEWLEALNAGQPVLGRDVTSINRPLADISADIRRVRAARG
jgi:septum formation inhibitor-activating ATPase MinD